MDENAAASLALDAYQTLEGIGEDVAQIKGQNSDVLAALGQIVARDQESTMASDEGAVALDLETFEEVPVTNEPPANFWGDLMGFQWMQTVLMVFMLVALLLNLGATLWLSFSDKWRS